MTDENSTPPMTDDGQDVLLPDESSVQSVSAQNAGLSQSKAKTDSVPRTMFNYVVIAATFLFVGLLIGTQINTGTSIDEATLERIVAQAVDDGGSNVDSQMVALADDDPYIGDLDAPITIVEFSAYACPYCARHFVTTFEPLLENYGEYVRYVYRDFPTINPSVSEPAALAANCAHAQGKFWDFHHELFNNQQLIGNSFFLQTASQLELDMDAFSNCLDEERYADEIEQDFLDGVLNGVQGTPGFFVNGQFISGAQPYEIFERAILVELRRLGITPAQNS